MINQYSINAINKIKQDATLIKPLYGSYCFSNITTFFHNLFNNNVLTKLPHDVLGDLHNKYDNIINMMKQNKEQPNHRVHHLLKIFQL